MKTKSSREDTRITFLQKEIDKEGKYHYILTCQNLYQREITNKTGDTIWYEKTSDFNEPVRLLGRLSELMEKYDIQNLDFLDSLLELFRNKIVIIEHGDKTRFHHLKYFNSDYAFHFGTSVNCAAEISATDFERLKMFLPKQQHIKID